MIDTVCVLLFVNYYNILLHIEGETYNPISNYTLGLRPAAVLDLWAPCCFSLKSYLQHTTGSSLAQRSMQEMGHLHNEHGTCSQASLVCDYMDVWNRSNKYIVNY